MAFHVIYDANVLYPAPLRDLLLRLPVSGLVRAQWTETLLDECFGHIRKNRPDLKPRKLDRTRELMNKAVADCLVTGYEGLVGGLTLPDANDRHVLAAAIRAGAQAIVTMNVKDFPEENLANYNVEAIHPDEFVEDLIDLAPGLVTEIVIEQAGDLKNPPMSVSELLDTLDRTGLGQSVAAQAGS